MDWLHWGGQLIVSGPDSLDRSKARSWSRTCRPPTAGHARSRPTTSARRAECGWTISTRVDPGRAAEAEPRRGRRSSSTFAPRPAPLPGTGELFAERRVGRGRIVVSAMQLGERDLINWRIGFQSLFNACLLRRPPREYRKGYFGDVTLAWADEALPAAGSMPASPRTCGTSPATWASIRPIASRKFRTSANQIPAIQSIRPAGNHPRSTSRRSTRAASARGTISAPRPTRPAKHCAKRPASRCPTPRSS